MSLAAILGLATGVLTIGVAISVWPVFRACSRALALWLLALTLVGVSTSVVENVSLMSMLSLSQAYAKADASTGALFQILRGTVSSTRNWAHYTQLMFAGCSLVAFYFTLFRFRLETLLVLRKRREEEFTGVAMPLFGHPGEFLLLAPLGVSHLALAVWLLVKGFQHPAGEGG